MRFTTMNVKNNIGLEAQQIAQKLQLDIETDNKENEYTKQISEELNDEKIVSVIARYQAKQRGARKYEYDR